MNSTQLGDVFEEKIYEIFRSLIETDQFWAKKECCKIFRKKGYYSKDRSGNIVFDVSIEIYLPGATDYSSIVFIECKNYTHKVPVNDVEEFFTKVEQVSSANSKAILASTAPFNQGTFNFSKSKKIGLIRYFDPSGLKWELMRSPSTTASSELEDEAIVREGLLREDFVSTYFDLYLQSEKRATNSLWHFMDDFVSDGLNPSHIKKIRNSRAIFSNQIPFIEKNDLEERSAVELTNIDYRDGEVSLDAICAREQQRCGLKVISEVVQPSKNLENPILGRIEFSSLEIHIFKQDIFHRGRERFTLAHELSHHLLAHGAYMVQESCDEGDYTLRRSAYSNENILRMEYQANYLAACLLMPKTQFTEDFKQIAKKLDIADKGFGALFVDYQMCNIHSYMQLTDLIMQKYGVSRKAASIRLESLGFLKDSRANAGGSVYAKIDLLVFRE